MLPVVYRVIGNGVDVAGSTVHWIRVVHPVCTNRGAQSINRLGAEPDHEAQVASEFRLKRGLDRRALVQDAVDVLNVGPNERRGSIDFGR